MKYFIATIYTTVFIVASVLALDEDPTVSMEIIELDDLKVAPMANVSWSTPCATNAGGGGDWNFTYLDFGGCTSNKNCTVEINTNYDLIMTFYPSANETSVILLNFTAFSGDGKESYLIDARKSANFTFNTNTQARVTVPILFSSAKFPNPNKIFDLQVIVYKQLSAAVHTLVCRTFPVNVKAVPGNEGNTHSAPCSTLYKPCYLENSVCLPGTGQGRTCQCNAGNSVYENTGKRCKKLVGASCENSVDCIANAECKKVSNLYGECACAKGYVSDATVPQICYEFKNGTYGNKGDAPGVDCAKLYEPCAFSNSLCIPSGSNKSGKCQCDDASVLEASLCKKIVGTLCQNSNECLQNGECVPEIGLNFGFCDCVGGYAHGKEDYSKCAGASSILLSMSLIVALQVVAFLNKIF